MAFTLSATNETGSLVSFLSETARGALEKLLELERSGIQAVTVKDDKGTVLSRADLEELYTPKKTG
jgi:hypothetical protein